MTRSPVDARRATVDDLDELLLLWSQAREELGRSGRLSSATPVEQFRVRLLDALTTGDLIVLIGRHEGQAAGYAVLRLAPALLVESSALHIEQLFVLPSMRRRGIARALLIVTTSIAERNGAEQVLAGAAPSARESHRFLARLGFSPMLTRRVVGTSTLRRRLAGEAQRRGLDDLLSRRRSLRARALRGGWGRPAGHQADDDPPGDDQPGDDPPGEGLSGDDPPGEGLSGDDPPGEGLSGDDPPGDGLPQDGLPGDLSRQTQPGRTAGDGPEVVQVRAGAAAAARADRPEANADPQGLPDPPVEDEAAGAGLAGDGDLRVVTVSLGSERIDLTPLPGQACPEELPASPLPGRRRGRQRA